jgi:hypothetical protein
MKIILLITLILINNAFKSNGNIELESQNMQVFIDCLKKIESIKYNENLDKYQNQNEILAKILEIHDDLLFLFSVV